MQVIHTCMSIALLYDFCIFLKITFFYPDLQFGNMLVDIRCLVNVHP